MTTTAPLLRPVALDALQRTVRPPVDAPTLIAASEIVDHVRDQGETAIREYAERFGERTADQPLVLGPADMQAALSTLSTTDRDVLERTAQRIRSFATHQRDAISPLDIPIQGGRAGHTIEPITNAGCYAPAGRYPLPSTVLMTAVTVRVAGCQRVVVASPGADPITLAAAAIAGADEFLAVGGAHAIAALAYGYADFNRCDVIVGPGNKWVTAAKQLLSGVVGIDMLAGPSELLILADDSANPDLIAADLLAQAEHDADAVPMLVTTSPDIASQTERALNYQLDSLTTSHTARQALNNGFICTVTSTSELFAAADIIAAEHLEIMTEDPHTIASQIRNAGALFIGSATAEVFGDYGAGPNHTLPTGGTARFQAGLSIIHFIRLRTWLHINSINNAQQTAEDASRLAQLEGLAGHDASARARL